jgi:hypothetical protein
MAGKAQEVAPVVHKFMYIHAGNDRGGALFGAYEIDHQQQKDREQQPGKSSRTGMAMGGETGVVTAFAMSTS